MNGKVLGVASFTLLRGQNLNFALTPNRLLSQKEAGSGQLPFDQWAQLSKAEATDEAEKLVAEGVSLFRIGEYENALAVLQSVVKSNPDHLNAWKWLGICADRVKRDELLKEAASHEVRLTSPKPDSIERCVSLFTAYSRLGRHEEAIRVLQQGSHMNPGYPLNFLFSTGLAAELIKLHRYAEAVEALKPAIQQEPNFAYSYALLGRAYLELGKSTQAIKPLKMALLKWKGLASIPGVAMFVDPDHLAQIYLSLGEAYLMTDQAETAIKTFRVGLGNPMSEAEALGLKSALATAYLAARRYDDALKTSR
jgi:tetratricopeptide (TPR) repeat protein